MAKSGSMSNNRIIFITALSMSLTFGLLDIYIGLTSSKNTYSIFTILFPLALTTATYFIVYIVGWYLIVNRFIKSFKLNLVSALISWGLFLGIPVLAVSLFPEIYSNKALFGKLLSLIFQAVLSGIAAVLVYLALTKISEIKKAGISGLKAGLLIPVLIGETVLFSYVMQFASSPVTKGAYILVLLVTIGIFFYIKLGKTIILSALSTLLLIIVLGGAFSVFVYQDGGLDRAKWQPQAQAADIEIKHVILISVDTLRTDVLSSYGSQKVQTPNIDGLSEDGVLFKNAYSSAPWTLPSFASMMTGLPARIHKTIRPKTKIPKQLKTTAEYMLEHGYYTGGIVRNVFLHPEYNMDQGFVDYFHYPKSNKYVRSFGSFLIRNFYSDNLWNDVSTEEITDLSITWLKENKDKNFFLWVHYFDPHIPYEPPQKYMAKDITPPEGMGMKFKTANLIRSGHYSPNKTQREWIKELYDAEVRYVDDNIGRLTEYLKSSGLYDDSLIIFTSDHGEEFWDHGGFEHGHTLYDEVIHVPLIVKLPGENKARIEETRVSTQSIMRTILDASGIEYEENKLIARSLYPMILEGQNGISEEPIVSTGLLYYEDRESLIEDDKKYIHFLVSSQEEMYDLANDPGEKTDLKNQDLARKSQETLKAYNSKADKLSLEHGVEKTEEVELSKDKKDKLKALDYIQ